MYKQQLLNVIVNEMNICRRLYTRIPYDKKDFRPKNEVRSIHELLQYLTIIGAVAPNYWLNKKDTDFNIFFADLIATSSHMHFEDFLPAMDKQIDLAKKLFDQVNDEDLLNTIVKYPWGGEAALGEAIISTSIIYMAAYKLQLFSLIKLCTDQKLGTVDAWILTELE